MLKIMIILDIYKQAYTIKSGVLKFVLLSVINMHRPTEKTSGHTSLYKAKDVQCKLRMVCWYLSVSLFVFEKFSY